MSPRTGQAGEVAVGNALPVEKNEPGPIFCSVRICVASELSVFASPPCIWSRSVLFRAPIKRSVEVSVWLPFRPPKLVCHCFKSWS